MDESLLGKGGIPDKIDTRDHKWSEVGFGSAPFDWSVGYDVEQVIRNTLGDQGFKIPVKDQDGSGSCGGQAWAYYNEVLETLATKTFEERSAKFIYAQTYVPGGGSYGRDNCEILYKQGVAREAILSSYENNAPPSEAFMQRSQDITPMVREDAVSSKASYAQVDNPTIDSVAQAIRDNKGVVIGVRGQNNGTWTSVFPKIPTSFEWGHWIYVGKAKTISGFKYIGILNSWSSSVGEDGWQWISEDWFNCFLSGQPAVFSVWTHLFNPVFIPPAFHHFFNKNLRLNSTGDEVIALQTALQITGDFPANIKPTGFFGNVTLASVIKFQKKNKITPAVGYCGPVTRKHLNFLFGQ